MPNTLSISDEMPPRTEWGIVCSVKRALDVVGNRSTLLLLREAFYGTTRFDEFVRRVQLSEPVAAARLRGLVDEGLLVREPYQEPGQRTRMAYRLSEKGAEIVPALIALLEWGDRWLAPDGAPIQLRHQGCGAPIHVELRCEEHHDVGLGEIVVTPGEGFAATGGS